MSVCNLFQSVFHFNKYKLADSVKANPNLIYFKTDLLLIILITYY